MRAPRWFTVQCGRYGDSTAGEAGTSHEKAYRCGKAAGRRSPAHVLGRPRRYRSQSSEEERALLPSAAHFDDEFDHTSGR
jgi:hypothetical protein